MENHFSDIFIIGEIDEMNEDYLINFSDNIIKNQSTYNLINKFFFEFMKNNQNLII